MPETVQDLIRKAATTAGVPPALALAVAEQESGFNPTLFGPELTIGGKQTRAVGTFQLLPSTADGLGIDPLDPRQNITGGVTYLRQLLDKHQGDLSKVLGEYGGVVRDQTYVPGVLERLTKFSAAPVPVAPGTTEPVRTLPPVATRGMLAPSTPTGDPTVAAEAPGLLASMAAAYDPRTPEGRATLAGTAGAIGVGLLTRGAVARPGIRPWLARVLGPPTGAAMAGGAEAAVEQAYGSLPQQLSMGEAALRESMEQGAYEAGGRLFMWPLRRVGGAFLASRVGRQAAAGLAHGVSAARETGRTAVEAVRSRVQEGLDAARVVAEATREAAVQRGRAALTTARRAATAQQTAAGRLTARQVAVARTHAAQQLADTELQNAAAITDLTRQYDNLLMQPPSVAAAGQLTREAIEGPAKRALDMAGQRVAEAAAGGPALALTPLKGALDEMAAKARPPALFPARETPRGIGFLTGPSVRVGAAATTRMSREDFQKYMAQQLGVEESHPLPGILGQIQQAPEEISFADAHRLKMLLDEAVNWDRVAKRHLEKITKGVRGVLRDLLSVHEPYNTATAAYQAIVPLYRRGVGKSVITAAANDPDRIARTLNPKNPAQALALKDLLVTQSAAGGDPVTGVRAWDAVRSAFTYTTVIKGGIEGLSERVHRLVEQSPEFAKAVFDDEPAQRVLSNLDRLGQAYQLAQQTAAEQLAGAKLTGQAAVEAARVTGAETRAAARATGTADVEAVREAARQAVRAARVQGRQAVTQQARTGRTELRRAEAVARAAIEAAKTQQARFAGSSIGAQLSFEAQVANMIRAFGLGPGSIWGGLSIVRLLESPKASDLVEWAAYSDRNTQRLVGALTGQWPDRVTAGILREAVQVLYPPRPSEATP